jgi:DNA-binding MarR family transcriptional regulator
MSQQLSLEQSYLALVEFLMLSKQRLLEIGAKYHLSNMQTITLLLLEEPRPMGSLRHVFNCDASNVTGIIDGLEQKQLAKRYEVHSDRRVKMVKLLARGKHLRTTLLAHLTSDDQYVLANLSPSEAKSFIDLVQKITDTTQLIKTAKKDGSYV